MKSALLVRITPADRGEAQEYRHRNLSCGAVFVLRYGRGATAEDIDGKMKILGALMGTAPSSLGVLLAPGDALEMFDLDGDE